MRNSLVTILAVAAFALLAIVTSLPNLARLAPEDALSANQDEEVLYLPNGQALQFISFGYQNALSQLLWFNTISYFGKHYQRDRNYRWLAHMCDLVTTLNPLADHTYLFCSTMLAWEASDPSTAIALLSKAISVNKTNWYWYYLRGFDSLFFLKDKVRAREDFTTASTLPGHPYFVTRLAARTVEELESTEAAVEFLRNMLEKTSDPSAHAALRGRLEKLEREALKQRGVLP